MTLLFNSPAALDGARDPVCASASVFRDLPLRAAMRVAGNRIPQYVSQAVACSKWPADPPACGARVAVRTG